jgi:hypothetical protein
MPIPYALGKKLLPIAVGGAAVHGFAKGIGSQDVSSNAYEMLTGDPNIDDYVLGRNAGLRSLMLPLPGSAVNGMTQGGFNNSIKAGAYTGGALGGLVGGGLAGGFKSRRGILAATVGAAMGAGLGGFTGFQGYTQGYVNSTTLADGIKSKSYNNNLPYVDGSLVLGAYNTRMGGGY